MRDVNKILETDATGNCLRREGKAETLASISESQESSGSGDTKGCSKQEDLLQIFKSGKTPRCLPQLLQKIGGLLSGGAEVGRLWTQIGRGTENWEVK